MKTSLPLNLSSLIASFFLTTSAFAQTIWTAGVGNWFTPGNWSAGVPNPASGTSFDAQINNGGIAQIFSPGASVRRITLGASNGQGGGLQINAGTLNVTENLHLGEGGNGVATISNGSTVTSNYTRIGRFNGSSGSATVFGEGSTWRTTLDFLVGESGSGALVADAGGDVVVGNNLLVANVLGAPQSSVTVRGAGSTITVNGSVLRVGAAGNGILKIETNGAVSAATVEIGNTSGSVGTLNLETGGTLTVGGGAQPLVLAKLAGSSGTLNIGNVGAAGVLIASAVQVGSGTGVVNFHSSGTTAFAVPITGAASVNKLGAGTTTLTAVNTFTRAVTVSGGVLELANGGQINNAFDSNVTEGLVRITGAGSKWANTATTIIGDSATGAISVESGGELRANAALLVSRVGTGNGTLTVTGAGSTATTNGELRIADQGAGLLEILDGGVVTSGHGYLAQNTVLASATAHISGPNSRWSITGFLDVGNRGAGTLNIENAGAVVNTAGGYVGFIGGSNGAAIVDGAGSVWDSNFFQVGGSGVGSLTIRNGGTAISRLAGTNSVSLGEATSGNGTVTVNGAGSTWTNLGSIVIGTNGRGTMNVQAGGYASAGPNASIGYNSGAIGTATVTGAGSQFNVPGMLTVGGRSDSTTTAGGSGTLTVADGGLVTVGGTGAPSATSGVMRIGWQTGSTGVVNVTGPGSTLTSDYFVVIGSAGNGTMTISNGGYVLTDSTGIGNSAGSTGLLTVTGAGSRYDDTYGIYLGLVGNGVGTLAISDGGLVNVVGGTGTVTVGSASSTGASTLRIGTGAGAGTLAAGGVSLVRTFSKLEFNHTDNTTFSVPITGAGFVNKLGFGTTTLNIPNSYTGGTTINGGTVRVIETTGAGLGTGAVTVNTFGRLNFGDQGLGGSNTVNVFASPTSNGYGGVLSFTETASAGALRVFQYGTTFPSVYTESETYFDDSSTAGAATFTNFGGQAGGNAHGGAVFFLGNGSAGNATFTNNGAAVAGAGGGFVTIQRDARGGTARFINNGTSTLDSRGLGNGGSVGITERANAENATFTNNGGTASGGSSGGVAVSREASAGSATFTNMPGTVSGAPGGRVSFYDTATAESATIANLGATVNGANAGVTRFQDMATAGASTIRNARSVAASGAGGTTVFANTALAGTATITNEGSQNGTYGFTEFRDTSNAASATFFNGASLTAGTFGGRPIFLNSSSAGSAIFDNEGSKVTNGFAGEVFFQDTSNAATSIITNRGATAADAFSGGIAYFLNSATGGAVNIVNEGSNFTNGTNTSGGSARFNDTTSAGNATILNGSATSVSGNPGGTFFYGSSTAGSAAINNSGGTVNPGGWTALSAGGAASFTATSSAGSATITNAAAPAMNSSGGHTSFVGTSTAGTATINNQGGVVLSNGWGAVAGGGSGYVTFGETATAGSATIDNQGAAVAGGGRGTTTFSGNSNAGNATIYIDAGIGAGGEVQFSGTSDGGTARIILAGTGVDAGGLDISLLTSGGMGLGSIEGEGVVSLGAKYLTVGKTTSTPRSAG